MANPLNADRIVRVLRAEGCTVREVRQWRTHNRNHKGPWGPVNGVMLHHTATSGTDDTVRLCYNGRSDLPGPLCLGVIDKQGVIHLVGNGRANHAGNGDDDVLRAVIGESYGAAPPRPNENNTDGNARFYGFECINRGNGSDPWPAAQLEAMERAAAALCRPHGWGPKSVIGHKEWTNQKIDPRGFAMSRMRERIAERLRHRAGWDQPLTSEDARQMWTADGFIKAPAAGTDNPYWQPASYLRDTNVRLRAVQGRLTDQAAAITNLARALEERGRIADADALVAGITEAIDGAAGDEAADAEAAGAEAE